jgi:acetyl-CoA synthetase
VVGAADETTGQAVVAFVIAKASQAEALASGHDELEATLKAHVAEHIGAIARPKRIFIVQELPKTRSGKIMRRLLRDVAEGRAVGDTTTLADTQVMSVISSAVAADD